MTATKEIRNTDGKFLCELAYDGKAWNVMIKRKGVATMLILTPDGMMHQFEAPADK